MLRGGIFFNWGLLGVLRRPYGRLMLPLEICGCMFRQRDVVNTGPTIMLCVQAADLLDRCCAGSYVSFFFQMARVMAAIRRAKVRRACGGLMFAFSAR